MFNWMSHWKFSSLLRLVTNPILYTAWLDNHAMTLKSNSAKYYFHEKSRFLHTFLKFKLSSKTFYFQSYNCFKILMYGKPATTCFKYKVYMYGSEAITYLSAILWVVTQPLLWVIRLPPTPTTVSPPPPLSITFAHLKENFSMVKLPYLCKRENLYGRRTITCEITIPKPCV